MANSGITKIEFIDAGFKAILTSEGCQEVVGQTAQSICDKANANNDRGGEGFRSSTQVGGYGGGRQRIKKPQPLNQKTRHSRGH